MEGKNIPPIITLSAAMIAFVICVMRGASLYTLLKILLVVTVIFYIIGRIVQKILVKINKDAEEAALQRQKEEQERAAKELQEAELEQKMSEHAGEGTAEPLTVSDENIKETSSV